jgi:hypothetical protein
MPAQTPISAFKATGHVNSEFREFQRKPKQQKRGIPCRGLLAVAARRMMWRQHAQHESIGVHHAGAFTAVLHEAIDVQGERVVVRTGSLAL